MWLRGFKYAGLLAFLLSPLDTLALSNSNLTLKHEEGRCAIRGNCGKPNVFSGELPCADNGLAEEPKDDLREQIVSVCGDKWSDGMVCCTSEQVGWTLT